MAFFVDYAETDRQREVAELMDQGLSGTAIAKKLGIDERNGRRRVEKIKARAHDRGYNPDYGMLEGYPLNQKFTKATIHRRADGTIIQTWDRMSTELQGVMQTAEAIAEHTAHKIQPIPEIPQLETDYDLDVISWYQIGDGHLGMLAHESQVGHAFDLDIAERELKFAMASLIARSKPSERCVINDLGDCVHFDNESATTAKSGHALDAAAPVADVARCYIECITFIIETALTRHKYVDVIINQGNHSRVMDLVNAHNLRKLYEKNPRVTILDNSCVFIGYRMGNTFVMTHHSDTCKPAKLADVMQSDFAQDWGESFYRYIDIGHVHHGQQLKERAGVTVESWNQMAPSDKYAHDNGYRSRQFLSCVERSKTYGEQCRFRITAEEVKDRIMKLAPGTTAKTRRKVHTV